MITPLSSHQISVGVKIGLEDWEEEQYFLVKFVGREWIIGENYYGAEVCYGFNHQWFEAPLPKKKRRIEFGTMTQRFYFEDKTEWFENKEVTKELFDYFKNKGHEVLWTPNARTIEVEESL